MIRSSIRSNDMYDFDDYILGICSRTSCIRKVIWHPAARSHLRYGTVLISGPYLSNGQGPP